MMKRRYRWGYVIAVMVISSLIERVVLSLLEIELPMGASLLYGVLQGMMFVAGTYAWGEVTHLRSPPHTGGGYCMCWTCKKP